MKRKGLLSRFRTPALSPIKARLLLEDIKALSPGAKSMQTELRFYVEVSSPLTAAEQASLDWLLAETFEPDQYGDSTFLKPPGKSVQKIFEVGPRPGLVTPWCSNAVLICHACGLTKVQRIEKVRRYSLIWDKNSAPTDDQSEKIIKLLYDRMTEAWYKEELQAFTSGQVANLVQTVPVLEQGKPALKKFCVDMGLALSDIMLDYIVEYFSQKIRRNPTDVELFMIGQLWSDHCRHLKFTSKFIIDGKTMAKTLFEWIKSTFEGNPGDVAVAFSDNAAILWPVSVLIHQPSDPLHSSPFIWKLLKLCLLFKVETHNHPTTISPYAGAATGVAVRRDIFGAGRGGVPIFHVAGYYVGPLFIPGYELPWEKFYAPHPTRLAFARQIITEASNGASDNANCFGNPVIIGTFTSFGQMVGKVHYQWTKTAMVAGSGGYLHSVHIHKKEPGPGYLIVQLGGDAYRIGLGGGSGSSMEAASQAEDLDFNSVQRDNAIMEKGNFDVFLACFRLGVNSPIEKCSDFGAGGCSVVYPELVHPYGCRIEVRQIPIGDSSMEIYIIWCDEAQERMAVLVKPENLGMMKEICERNRCPMKVVGEVTADKQFNLTDMQFAGSDDRAQKTPIDVASEFLLSDLPQTVTDCTTEERQLLAPEIPKRTLVECLQDVLCVPKVGSKEFLTKKADRSVTGLIAQQQECGYPQLPVADCAVVAAGYQSDDGFAFSLGEQPIVGLVNTEAGVRMSIAEALLNLAGAQISGGLKAVNMSATWQWPCGQSGEDARLYQSVKAVAEYCKALGIRIAVGKDSVSMTANTVKDGQKWPIRSPGTVQIFAFAPCADITKTVTPDLKAPGKSKLMFLNASGGNHQRLGGSAWLQTLNQLGDEAPDAPPAEFLARFFAAVQHMVKCDLLLSYHDRSDGGLITCLLEMAFSGNCGFEIMLRQDNLKAPYADTFLLNQELGAVIEYLPKHEDAIRNILKRFGLSGSYHVLGQTLKENLIKVDSNNEGRLLWREMSELRAVWRETSFQLYKFQASPETVEQERKKTLFRTKIEYPLSFKPKATSARILKSNDKPKVAVIRELGTNGDQELAAVLSLAGFEVIDIHMTDLISGKASLKPVQMTAWPGGFGFGDVMDAAKGLAGVSKFNPNVARERQAFLARPDTCSFGPCNGCQFMDLDGVVPWQGIAPEKQPRFIVNRSEIFESRLVNVRIMESDSIFLKGMAGSVLPIIVAHHEGRLHFPDKGILQTVLERNLAPIRYLDDMGRITEDYPFNPNGSPQGIAGLISKDGRHLAMMPHPERLFKRWQNNVYWPPEWSKIKVGPWLQLFQNAAAWCREHK